MSGWKRRIVRARLRCRPCPPALPLTRDILAARGWNGLADATGPLVYLTERGARLDVIGKGPSPASPRSTRRGCVRGACRRRGSPPCWPTAPGLRATRPPRRRRSPVRCGPLSSARPPRRGWAREPTRTRRPRRSSPSSWARSAPDCCERRIRRGAVWFEPTRVDRTPWSFASGAIVLPQWRQPWPPRPPKSSRRTARCRALPPWPGRACARRSPHDRHGARRASCSAGARPRPCWWCPRCCACGCSTPGSGSTTASRWASPRTRRGRSPACCARTGPHRCTTSCCTDGWRSWGIPSPPSTRSRCSSGWPASPRPGGRGAASSTRGPAGSARCSPRSTRSSRSTAARRGCTRWSCCSRSSPPRRSSTPSCGGGARCFPSSRWRSRSCSTPTAGGSSSGSAARWRSGRAGGCSVREHRDARC